MSRKLMNRRPSGALGLHVRDELVALVHRAAAHDELVVLGAAKVVDGLENVLEPLLLGHTIRRLNGLVMDRGIVLEDVVDVKGIDRVLLPGAAEALVREEQPRQREVATGSR
jgi:hypothetical protein